MVNSILESFRQCCHGFYFFYQHPECFVSADETLTLYYIKWREWRMEFPAVKVSFSGALNHQRRSQTHALHHTENAVFGTHDHHFPPEISVFSLFFLHIYPTEWFYWRENALKPTTNMLNVYILYISALVWLVFDVGFTGNTGSFS